ncbi:hypothetical protein Ccrd_017073 [Cynara cardunculus var. scolymus]|uniref:Uncharacterized protein n=1 Tax=Cynara cardunculus var. scolymus TaxID=59895 RepID=A0A118K2M7_CYNCS|nr:hypothetical protein Ccrd_017104 [Cynara cardunculus var. scolymus]KVI04608.1 hypothetical protein Ccrd_017073 [Cynara cardunculus var. scolymus]
MVVCNSQGKLLKSCGTQVAEPLRAIAIGVSLEDTRHPTLHYDTIWQEVEAQVIEVFRRSTKVMDGTGNQELRTRLEADESEADESKWK